MANIYLQTEFKTGNLFQYSKDQKDGFEEYVSKTNKISYRRYIKEGVYGIYRGTSVRDTAFGKELSIHMIDAKGDDIYISLPLFDQNKNIATYAESFISVLPAMQMNFVYRIFPYAMDREGTDYKNYGVSVRHADMEAKTVREDYQLDRLSYSYETKEGEKVEGDIPAVVWVKDFDGTMKKTQDEKNRYLYGVLTENSTESTGGASNKTSGGEPPKAYTGAPTPPPAEKPAPAKKEEPTTVYEQETPAEKPAPAPEAKKPAAPAPKAVEEPTPAKAGEKKNVDLPF